MPQAYIEKVVAEWSETAEEPQDPYRILRTKWLGTKASLSTALTNIKRQRDTDLISLPYFLTYTVLTNLYFLSLQTDHQKE